MQPSGITDRSRLWKYIATVCVLYTPQTGNAGASFAVGNLSRLPIDSAPSFLKRQPRSTMSILSEGDDTFIHFIIGHSSGLNPLSLYVRVINSFQWEFLDRHGLSFYGFLSEYDSFTTQFFRQASLLSDASLELQYQVTHFIQPSWAPRHTNCDALPGFDGCVERLNIHKRAVWVFYVRFQLRGRAKFDNIIRR